MSTSIISKVTMNTRKVLWLCTPTQLLIQGQWWSNLSTHLLQIAQCLLRGVRKISQSGHISQGCTLESTSIKGYFGRKIPGSLELAVKNANASTIDSSVIEYAKKVVF